MPRARYRIVAAAAAAVLLAAPAAPQTAADLFDDTSLHDVWIHINDRDWAQLRARFTEDTYYPCDVEWRDLKVRNAGCRSRGTGSRNGMKPGLRVDFNRYVSGQTFLGLRSLVLDNLWQDPSMIKERLSMRLFAQLGIAAPREAHARLHVGSARDYAGLYAIVEDIDTPFLLRNFDNADGYLYEYRWIDSYGFEDLGADLEPYATRFEARTHERESTFTLYSPVRELVWAINQVSGPDAYGALARLFDLPALMRHLAAENYLADWDGLLGHWGLDNFYLHRSSGTGLFQFIGWDKDLTFSWLLMPPWHHFDDNVLTRTIAADARLRAAYLRALVEAAAAAGGLEREAERAYDQIREAALADPVKPYSNEQFEDACDDVRRFARERVGVVRGFVGTASVAEVGPGVARPGHR